MGRTVVVGQHFLRAHNNCEQASFFYYGTLFAIKATNTILNTIKNIRQRIYEKNNFIFCGNWDSNWIFFMRYAA